MSPLYTKLQELGGLWTSLSHSKLKNILLLSCCILKTRSCNLQTCRDEVASVTGETNLKQATAYARLKRVFQTGVILPVQKALFLMVLHLIRPGAGSLLIMDRTDFGVGSGWVNLLVMGLRWHGVFIPLIWKDLGQRGNSSQQDRICLLDRMLAWWKASGLDLPVLCVVGDREFIGQDWFWALEQRKLRYVIRIKSNLEFQVWFNGDLKHRPLSAKVLARYMAWTATQQMEVAIKGTVLTNLVRLELEDPTDKEDFVLLITNLADWHRAQPVFRQRWSIECCFKHTKTNGFGLEDVNLQGPHKIDLLFAILAFVYTLAIYQGIEDEFDKVVPPKRQANGKVYPQQSLFRFGLYQLKLQVKELKHLIQYLIELIEKLWTKYRKLIFVKSIVQS